MKIFAVTAALLLAAPGAAQITPVAPIVKGTGLPPPGAEEAGVMTPVDAFFAGLATRDGAAMLATTRPEGGATMVVERADGSRSIRHLSWSDFAAAIRPGPERYRETLTDPAIETDGDIAMIWSPYVFAIDGKVDHCGIDHFDLVRDAAGWKILSVTWSQRSTGCEAG